MSPEERGQRALDRATEPSPSDWDAMSSAELIALEIREAEAERMRMATEEIKRLREALREAVSALRDSTDSEDSTASIVANKIEAMLAVKP